LPIFYLPETGPSSLANRMLQFSQNADFDHQHMAPVFSWSL
jgi:hypothetical protein